MAPRTSAITVSTMGNHPGKMDFSKMSLALLKLVPKIFDFSKMILHHFIISIKTDHRV